MFPIKIVIAAAVALLSAFGVIEAQSAFESCQAVANTQSVNASLLVGDWYEAVRAPAANIACVHINAQLVNNHTQFNVTTNYAASNTGVLMNKYKYATANATIVSENQGFNVSSGTETPVTFKILDTDYTAFAVLCGYTNATDNATSFGVILTRNQLVNSTWLAGLKHNASQILTSFNQSTTANVLQTKSCHNSAAASASTLAALFAVFYMICQLF